MTIQAIITDDFDNPIPNVNISELETQNGTITNAKGQFTLNVQNASNPIQISHVAYTTKIYDNALKFPSKIILDDINTLDEIVINATKPKSKTLKYLTFATLGFIVLLKFGKASAKKTKKDAGLKGKKCNNRVKCTGLKKDGTLRKGYKYAKGGKIIKIKPKKRGLRKPIVYEL